MKFLNYIKYFLFIAINWDPRLAWFTIMHERRGEKKYGINSTGVKQVSMDKKSKELLKHAEAYQGANYYLLEMMFDFLKNEQSTTKLVDFGCGKGRILSVAAHYGFKDITGIEIDGKIGAEGMKNIQSTCKKFPDAHIDIKIMSATDYFIGPDQSVFFFFNPFDEVIMLQVLKNILRSLKDAEREIFVGYINPVYKELFLSAGFVEVFYHEKLQYLECSILMYAPNLKRPLE